MAKACEIKFTDQSIFNSVYGTHVMLPASFNDAAHFKMDASHIVHFVGEPKPWAPNALHGRSAEGARRNATLRWLRVCAHAPNGTSTSKARARSSSHQR